MSDNNLSGADPFGQIADEFVEAIRQGKRPSVEEFARRYPAHADDIRDMLPALLLMEQAKTTDESPGLPHPAPASAAAPPLRQLGDYEILRDVGRGGMGVVYEAQQLSLSRHVAIKVLPAHARLDARQLVRFQREARSAAKLHHTNIVPVFGVGEQDGLHYYVMQFIQGLGLDVVLSELRRLRKPRGKHAPTHDDAPGRPTNLSRDASAAAVARGLLSGEFRLPDPAAVLTTAPGTPPAEVAESSSVRAGDASATIHLPGQSGGSTLTESSNQYWQSVARVGIQVADALAHAAGQGVLHRDIKPSNLLLDDTGNVWVTDFGLAKAVSDSDNLTQTGDIVGTLRYMAPERFDGHGDLRSDTYSLGLTLYEMLVLRPAFNEADRNKLVKEVMHGEPVRPRKLNPSVPRDLETVVLKAIARDPAHRYQTPGEMAEDLKRFVEDRPVRARRISTAEQFWRWCRRNPLPASLLAGMVLVFLMGFAGVSWQWHEARRREGEAVTARDDAEKSRANAQAETYRALLSEVRALRAGHEPGWRDEALADLARLAIMPTPRRNLLELRTEAVAALGAPDVRLIAQIETSDGMGSFAFGPDGQTLVTVGAQSGLDFWNVHELQHTAGAEALALKKPARTWDRNRVLYLPGGQGLAVTTRDQGVVFTEPSGKRASRPPITRGTRVPSQLAVDSVGRRIAVAWDNNAGVTVHDLASGKILAETSGQACALSPDGQWLAHEGPQFEVLLRRIGSKDPEKSVGRHSGNITKFAFSADGTLLGSASRDRTAILWDVTGRRQPVVLRGHRETLNDLAFSPDGGWVATACTDFTARIWDVLTGQSLATLPGQWFMLDVAWSPDGAFLAVGGDNSRIAVYRVTGRHIYQRLARHRNGVQCVAANPRLDRLATGADDHVVIDWDLAPTQPSRRWNATDPEYVLSVAYSPDGSLLASGTGYGTLFVRDAETGEIKARLAGHKVGIPALAFDPSGRRLASGDRSGRVILWDLATQQPVQQLQVGPSWVWSMAFLDESRKLVSEVSNGPIVLFDLQSGKAEARVTLPGGIRRFVADPARQRLIVAFNNGDLCSLSVPDLTPGYRLKQAHPSAIESLTLSPDGRLLATGGADRRVVFRDPVTFEPLLAFPEWTAMVKDLAFTHSGRRLAYVGADADIALWDLPLLYEGLQVAGLAWDQSASTVVSASGRATAGEHLRPAVPVLRRPATVDPALFEGSRRLVQSGVGAFQGGRWDEAIRDLQQARDRLRTLHHDAPRDGRVASLLAISLGFLSSALRNEHRLAEALAHLKESRQVLETIRQPSSVDLYNLACTYSNLSTLVEPGVAPPTAAEREALAERAMQALRRSLAASMPNFDLMARDPDLDPLRDRPDFRKLIEEAKAAHKSNAAPLPKTKKDKK